MGSLTPHSSCRVFELRQYTLHPGRRDELIELFDTHLVEPRLPVREDVEVLVVVTRFKSPEDMRASAGRLATNPAAAEAQRRLAAYQTAPNEYLVLEPDRSLRTALARAGAVAGGSAALSCGDQPDRLTLIDDADTGQPRRAAAPPDTAGWPGR